MRAEYVGFGAGAVADDAGVVRPCGAGYWPMPVGFPELQRGDVHVWRVGIAVSDADLAGLSSTLSSGEHARAKRFFADRARRRFVAARGRLRSLLSLYIGVCAADVDIGYGPYGKPLLNSGEVAGSRLHFNVSHCGDTALVALSTVSDVGVDLEYIDPDLDCRRLGQYFLSPLESAQMERLTARRQRQEFFVAWARKEAYLKGLGYGLLRDPRGVSFAAGDEADSQVVLDSIGRDAWSLRDLGAGPRYACAVAARGQGWKVRTWQWPDRGDGLHH